jgi:hypothetical protein
MGSERQASGEEKSYNRITRSIRRTEAPANSLLKFLDRKPKLWHSDPSLDERRLTRADGKRPLPPRMAKPKG